MSEAVIYDFTTLVSDLTHTCVQSEHLSKACVQSLVLSEAMILPHLCVWYLQDSFGLLAYTDPSSSPIRYLLDPQQREPVCAALNSAILGELTVMKDSS